MLQRKIVILDPLPSFRGALKRALEADGRSVVVAELGEIAQVPAILPRLGADALLIGLAAGMDVGGLCASMMKTCPLPIILLAESGQQSSEAVERALAAGALAVLAKPKGGGEVTTSRDWQRLVREVLGMAEVKVVRGRATIRAVTDATPDAAPSEAPPEATGQTYKVLAIGCSTGGPQALHMLLSGLPADFPLPVLVVQHMSPGFITGLANWLDTALALKVQIAASGQELLPGNVYIGPDDAHLVALPAGERLLAGLSDSPHVGGFRPSATTLLNSVARAAGAQGIGVLLTGMGSDGAAGLLTMREAGGLTIAQNEESSVVFGMAGVAVQMNAAQAVMPLGDIAPMLVRLTLGQA